MKGCIRCHQGILSKGPKRNFVALLFRCKGKFTFTQFAFKTARVGSRKKRLDCFRAGLWRTIKAIQLQALIGRKGSRRLRIPEFHLKVAFTSRRYPWYSFLLGAKLTPGPDWKSPMIPSGIEIATFRLVGQCLDQSRHACPMKFYNVKFPFLLCQILGGYCGRGVVLTTHPHLSAEVMKV